MSQATLDYYAVLHVSPEAPSEVIKASYRALSRKYHPDQNGGSSKFERKMQELNEAYAVLGDPERQEEYDETRYDEEEDEDEASYQEETPHLIKACPNCGTKNRLLQGATRPNCGKCGCSLDQQSSELPDFLGGRFQVVRLLGAGGFGQVFLCNDNRLGRQVAVKVLKEIESPASLRREATTLSNLSHPGLAKLFDYLEQDNKGVLVSEYVKGATLAQLTAPQVETDVLKWALALTDILNYIHNLSPPVIHRDIKPSNIIIDNHGNLRLLDFGISKKTVVNGATSTTALGGTPGYAPPEQYAARSGQTDAQSDLYSLGATLFWAITATHPPDAIERLQDDDALVFRRSRCSSSLQDLVRDLMQLKKQGRPTSAASVKSRLQAKLNKAEPTFERAEQPNGSFSDGPKPNTNYGYDLDQKDFMEPNKPTPNSYCFKREQTKRPFWTRVFFSGDDTTEI